MPAAEKRALVLAHEKRTVITGQLSSTVVR
jgi:hypothetical protein